MRIGSSTFRAGRAAGAFLGVFLTLHPALAAWPQPGRAPSQPTFEAPIRWTALAPRALAVAERTPGASPVRPSWAAAAKQMLAAGRTSAAWLRRVDWVAEMPTLLTIYFIATGIFPPAMGVAAGVLAATLPVFGQLARLIRNDRLDAVTELWTRRHLQLNKRDGLLPRIYRRALGEGRPLHGVSIQITNLRDIRAQDRSRADEILKTTANALFKAFAPEAKAGRLIVRSRGSGFWIILSADQDPTAVLTSLQNAVGLALSNPDPNGRTPAPQWQWRAVSSRDGENVNSWLERLDGRESSQPGAEPAGTTTAARTLASRTLGEQTAAFWSLMARHFFPETLDTRAAWVRAAAFAFSLSALMVIAVALVVPLDEIPATVLAVGTIAAVRIVVSQVAQRIREADLIDPDTGLLTRKALGVLDREPRPGEHAMLYRRFEAVREAQRASPDTVKPLTAMLVKIHDLDAIRRKSGFQGVEAEVIRVAAGLRAQLRPTDAIVHFESDKLLVLLPEMEVTVAARMAEGWLAEPGAVWGGDQAPPALSIGIAGMNAVSNADGEAIHEQVSLWLDVLGNSESLASAAGPGHVHAFGRVRVPLLPFSVNLEKSRDLLAKASQRSFNPALEAAVVRIQELVAKQPQQDLIPDLKSLLSPVDLDDSAGIQHVVANYLPALDPEHEAIYKGPDGEALVLKSVWVTEILHRLSRVQVPPDPSTRWPLRQWLDGLPAAGVSESDSPSTDLLRAFRDLRHDLGNLVDEAEQLRMILTSQMEAGDYERAKKMKQIFLDAMAAAERGDVPGMSAAFANLRGQSVLLSSRFDVDPSHHPTVGDQSSEFAISWQRLLALQRFGRARMASFEKRVADQDYRGSRQTLDNVAEWLSPFNHVVTRSDGKRLVWVTNQGEPVTAFVDGDHLMTAIVNLVSNAANVGATRVDIGVSRTPSGGAEIRVSDDAGGIPLHVLRDDVFKPGVSGRGSSGLGLAMVRSIVEAAGGRVSYDTLTDEDLKDEVLMAERKRQGLARTTRGTTFIIRLPSALPPAPNVEDTSLLSRLWTALHRFVAAVLQQTGIAAPSRSTEPDGKGSSGDRRTFLTLGLGFLTAIGAQAQTPNRALGPEASPADNAEIEARLRDALEAITQFPDREAGTYALEQAFDEVQARASARGIEEGADQIRNEKNEVTTFLAVRRRGTSRSRPPLIVFAHLDTLRLRGPEKNPGANDNATGVAAALEVLRQTTMPARDLIVVFVGDEEVRGFGQFEAFEALRDSWGVSPDEAAVLDLDTLGGRSLGVTVYNAPGASNRPAGIAVIEEAARRHGIPVTQATTPEGHPARTIAARHAADGFQQTAVTLGEPLEEQDSAAMVHSAGDVRESVNMEQALRATRFALAVVKALVGNGRGPLRRITVTARPSRAAIADQTPAVQKLFADAGKSFVNRRGEPITESERRFLEAWLKHLQKTLPTPLWNEFRGLTYAHPANAPEKSPPGQAVLLQPLRQSLIYNRFVLHANGSVAFNNRADQLTIRVLRSVGTQKFLFTTLHKGQPRENGIKAMLDEALVAPDGAVNRPDVLYYLISLHLRARFPTTPIRIVWRDQAGNVLRISTLNQEQLRTIGTALRSGLEHVAEFPLSLPPDPMPGIAHSLGQIRARLATLVAT